MPLDKTEIVYIGPKVLKRDNVANTDIVWNGYGDCQSVPGDKASKLLAYPSVWLTKEKFEALKSTKVDIQAPKKPSTKTDPQKSPNGKGDLSDLDSDDKDDKEDESADADGGDDDQQQDENLDSADNDPSKNPPPNPDANLSREALIMKVLLSMDRSNPQHFSEKTKNPFLEVVRELARDKTIALKELNAAWKELNSANMGE